VNTPSFAQKPADIDAAAESRVREVQGHQGRRERRLHPAACQGRSKIFGIAIITVDGKVYTVGDIQSEVSIQSISKVFTMAKVMEESGRRRSPTTWRRRHRDVFNSIIAIER